MAWDMELHLVASLAVAAACGAILGVEREAQRKPAGLRTNMLIALGSALFTYSSLALTGGERGGDPSRIAAQIVTGVGFLGAGTIMRQGGDSISGLTSAATVWVVAALGIVAGAGDYLMALIGALFAFVILHILGRFENRLILRYNKYRMVIEAEEREGVLSAIEASFNAFGVDMEAMDVRKDEAARYHVEVEYRTTRARNEGVQGQLRRRVAGLLLAQAQML